MLVASENGGAFLALDGYGNNFGVEASLGLGGGSALLRCEGELILLFASDLILLGEEFGGLAHEHLGHRAEESIAIHAID